MPGKVSEAFPPHRIKSKASHRNFRCGAFFLFPPAACGRDWGGRLIFCEKMLLGGTGGPGALQTSSDGERRYRRGNFRLLRMGEGKTRAEISDFCGARSEGKRNANFRENLMLAGAGGPVALQTSPPVRKLDRVASFSACGPSGLTLPGCARQLLNRRSGSARLRSTASQLLLAALRFAKQFSHMRSRR